MNPLEALKERLKHKPEVQPNQGVKVILAQKPSITVEEKTKPLITAEKDEGKRAKDILEKIRQKKLTTVVKKFTEEIREVVESKVPVIQEEKIKKPKKLPKELIVLEEEKEKLIIDLPEGGPRLEAEAEDELFEVPIDVDVKHSFRTRSNDPNRRYLFSKTFTTFANI